MMKIKILAAAIIITIFIVGGGGFWYAHSINPKIDCSGYVVWDIDHELFAGDIIYQMHNHQGIVTLTGVLNTPDAHSYKISRVIYFTYQKLQQNYIITTHNLVRYPSDELQGSHERKAMPLIYLSKDATFSFLIQPWREGWTFTTVGSPSLLCR